MVLLIYLYTFVVVVPASAMLLYLMARSRCMCLFMCVCMCESLISRAVFRNARQRRRGRLDPGCIHLGTGGAPSGSLEEEREGGRKKKCMNSC